MQLLLIALSTFLSEDLACITAGALVAQGKLRFLPATIACLMGILSGDLLLFLSGRVFGRALLRWKLMRHWVTPEQLDRATGWISSRGMAVVFLSRFTPGLRLPTYVAAGLLPTRFSAFAFYFLLASLVWTPAAVGATVLLGDQLILAAFRQRGGGGLALLGVAATSVLLLRLIRGLATRSGRRRMGGALRRIVRWEFWPPYVAYLPVIPYLVFLACKHRSLTIFTAANPGIRTGGFAGESKSEILGQLGAAAACYVLIRSEFSAAVRVNAATRFLEESGLEFPVVLKPDVGERGSGVAIIHSLREMSTYLARADKDVIVQRYVPGVEFGLFYIRRPSQERGRIFSITEKIFPRVRGDGRRSLDELILDDRRAACMADAYRNSATRPLDMVPLNGEEVALVELGSHCRGAIFLDGSRLLSPELEAAVESVARMHDGFYFGRFDVRSDSEESLRAGRFRVIELNGVTSEATHIYDPSVSIWRAYRTLFEQWRIAFEIGAANQALGCKPAPFSALARIVWDRMPGKPAAGALPPSSTPSATRLEKLPE